MRWRRVLWKAVVLAVLLELVGCVEGGAQAQGWVLVKPPVMEGWENAAKPLPDAPLTAWTEDSSHDSAEACELRKAKSVREVSLLWVKVQKTTEHQMTHWGAEVLFNAMMRSRYAKCVPGEVWWRSRP